MINGYTKHASNNKYIYAVIYIKSNSIKMFKIPDNDKSEY